MYLAGFQNDSILLRGPVMKNTGKNVKICLWKIILEEVACWKAELVHSYRNHRVHSYKMKLKYCGGTRSFSRGSMVLPAAFFDSRFQVCEERPKVVIRVDNVAMKVCLHSQQIPGINNCPATPLTVGRNYQVYNPSNSRCAADKRCKSLLFVESPNCRHKTFF